MGNITVKEQDTQTTPTEGYVKLYPKTDGKWYYKDDTGTEVELGAGAIAAHAATHKGGGSDEIDAATTSVAGLMSSTDKTKLDGVASGADVTGSNAPQAHKTSHQDGGSDEISVAGLSGVLADRQDANKLVGVDLAIADLTRRNHIVYDEIAEEWINEKLPCVPYGIVLAKDTTLSWADIEDYYKFVPVNTEPSVTSHVGNGTAAYLNGITAVSGDTYVVTDTGTLTAGSVSVTPGTVVMWYGPASMWITAVAAGDGGTVVGGLMVQLSTTTALISPYTDGTDDGKLIAFDGSDLVGEETSQDITITLPDPADLPFNDGTIKGMYYVGKMAAGGTVTVVPGGTLGKFMDGLDSVLITKKMQQTTLAVVNATLAATWMRISSITDYLQVRRAATWAATNFASPTPLPFDATDEAGNSDVSYVASTTRLYAALAGEYRFSGHVNIDTTGGSTWIFECYLRKNGTTEIPGSRIRTGNYQGEDMAVTLAPIQVELAVGDYIEWVFDHTNLTGQIYSAMMTMSTVY